MRHGRLKIYDRIAIAAAVVLGLAAVATGTLGALWLYGVLLFVGVAAYRMFCKSLCPQCARRGTLRRVVPKAQPDPDDAAKPETQAATPYILHPGQPSQAPAGTTLVPVYMQIVDQLRCIQCGAVITRRRNLAGNAGGVWCGGGPEQARGSGAGVDGGDAGGDCGGGDCGGGGGGGD